MSNVKTQDGHGQNLAHVQKKLELLLVVAFVAIVVLFAGFSIINSSKFSNGGKNFAPAVVSSIDTPENTPIEVDNSKSEDSIVRMSKAQIETDFPKNYFVYGETDGTRNRLEEFSTINEHQSYYTFQSPPTTTEISFVVGYFEGCPDGCFFRDKTSCPEACHLLENWRPEKTFKKTTNRDSNGTYYGVFQRNSDGYITTKRIGCEIGTDPLQLTRCSSFRSLVGEKEIRRIELDKEASVIVLP